MQYIDFCLRQEYKWSVFWLKAEVFTHPSRFQRQVCEMPVVAPSEMGSRLRGVRRRLGMTLREAAQASDLSPSFIGMVERGLAEIAVSRLSRLAAVYGISVASLLEDPNPPGVEVVPSGEVHGVRQLAAGYQSDFLGSPHWVMQPFRVTLEQGAQVGDLVHPGDEFYYCLQGEAKLVVSGSSHVLRPGDTLILPAYTHHHLSNAGSMTAVLVGAEVEAESAKVRTNQSSESRASEDESVLRHVSR